MEDEEIVGLYWQRSEKAIAETQKKYTRYCGCIAFNILHSEEDAEECVNETYLRAWNAILPGRPDSLPAFLGKITRNLSLNKYKQNTTQKRGSGNTELALSELEDCISTAADVEQSSDELFVREALVKFLGQLPKEKRMIFVKRYWYLMPIKEIAGQDGMSENKVKLILYRIRNELKQYLEKEGVAL